MTTLTGPADATARGLQPPGAGGLPTVVSVLAAGTFLLGTTEFMIAGLLPEMAANLGVSVARAGLLITAFAVGMIVGSPLMVILTLKLPRSFTLRAALMVFAIGHVVVALSSSFEVVVVARFVTALATGAFWAVGTVVATDAAGPTSNSRALGVLIGGLTMANIVGVPLGSFAGHLAGWRSPFWVLGALSLGAAVLIGRFLPPERSTEVPSIRSELNALRSTKLWLALSASGLVMGGVLAAYTYVAPLLTDRAGLSGALVPLALVGFGVGAFGGTSVGGRLGDRRPLATSLTAATATALVLCAIVLFSHNPVVLMTLLVMLGLAGFTVNPITSALTMRFAGGAPNLPAALSASAFNVGIAGGSWLAGMAFDGPLGDVGPAVVGAAISAASVIPLATLAIKRANRHRDSVPPMQGHR